MRFQKVKYEIINHDNNTSKVLQCDPINWETSEKTLKRSMVYFGVYTELSKNLEFVKDGADFLRNCLLYTSDAADE